MKTNTQRLVVLFVLIFTASNASANFTPVPASEGKRFTLEFGLDPRMGFEEGTKLTELGANAAFIYNIWRGLDVGAQIRGGIVDETGLFRNTTEYIGDLGGDVMVRYLVACCRFYFGAQVEFGYGYLFDRQQSVEENSSMVLSFGLPIGINFEEKIAVYMMPMIQLGHRSPTDTGIWGSLVSGGIAFGTRINVGGPSLIFEVSPHVEDFNDMPDTITLEAVAGIGFDF